MDIWSIEHFISGVSIGVLAMGIHRYVYKKKQGFNPEEIITRYFDVIFVLFIAYFWETIEHYLELGILGNTIAYWFHGVEFFGNRVITDPLLMVLGYMFVRKYSGFVWFARIFSVIWIVCHVFLFPHSMYLQDIIIQYFSS